MGEFVRSFKASNKKPDGYKKPQGKVIAWDDMTPHFVKGFYDRWGEKRDVYYKFSQQVLTAIKKGHMGLFVRAGYEDFIDKLNLPPSIKETSEHPYLVSLDEMKEQAEILAFIVKDEKDLAEGIGVLNDILSDIDNELPDYSDVGIETINSPIRKDRLKNSVYQDYATYKKRIAEEKAAIEAERLAEKHYSEYGLSRGSAQDAQLNLIRRQMISGRRYSTTKGYMK